MSPFFLSAGSQGREPTHPASHGYITSHFTVSVARPPHKCLLETGERAISTREVQEQIEEKDLRHREKILVQKNEAMVRHGALAPSLLGNQNRDDQRVAWLSPKKRKFVHLVRRETYPVLQEDLPWRLSYLRNTARNQLHSGVGNDTAAVRGWSHQGQQMGDCGSNSKHLLPAVWEALKLKIKAPASGEGPGLVRLWLSSQWVLTGQTDQLWEHSVDVGWGFSAHSAACKPSGDCFQRQ